VRLFAFRSKPDDKIIHEAGKLDIDPNLVKPSGTPRSARGEGGDGGDENDPAKMNPEAKDFWKTKSMSKPSMLSPRSMEMGGGEGGRGTMGSEWNSDGTMDVLNSFLSSLDPNADPNGNGSKNLNSDGTVNGSNRNADGSQRSSDGSILYGDRHGNRRYENGESLDDLMHSDIQNLNASFDSIAKELDAMGNPKQGSNSGEGGLNPNQGSNTNPSTNGGNKNADDKPSIANQSPRIPKLERKNSDSALVHFHLQFPFP
jgi:hypothetical protein